MKPPVFVLGCPRSGTTLLYHMLLSSGGFALYRSETQFFDMILPRFGYLRSERSRESLIEQWLASHYFERSGLYGPMIKERMLSECGEGADFLRIVMESIAENQNVDRWAETTPAHLLYIPEIKRAFPDALILHVIRDGRDCALSLDRQGWIAPLPWDRKHPLLAAGLYWEWMVRKGRESGRATTDYMEVSFEELTSSPAPSLARIGEFINHDLDYDRIQSVAIGSVSRPNTSFADAIDREGFKPAGRWKSRFPKEELALFEMSAGDLLEELGYELTCSSHSLPGRINAKTRRSLYNLYFETKHWAKSHTPLSRFLTDTSLLRNGPHNSRGRERVAYSDEEISNKKMEGIKN